MTATRLPEELDRVGFARRILRSRRWYGADWWFVAVAAVMVAGFLVVAAFPGAIAPYPPDVQVGPRFLPPGGAPDIPVVVSLGGAYPTLADLAASEERPGVAVARGEPTAGALREQAAEIDAELSATGRRFRPRIVRFDSPDGALVAVAAGDVAAAVVRSADIERLSGEHPGLVGGADITGATATAGGFILGTNQIGQDVLSRLIYGTRVALLIGFASAVGALVLGVPLGLVAGYVGGRLDRVLTLLMDSLYAFPGLILAIAITSVLGPSILNVVVAIAVLYVPTYYRIVRGQTLTVKEELYVEAARSLGATSGEILRRYVYPNVIPSVAVIFSVNVADAILTGAGLSFLGLGLPPNTADWGIDIARGQEFIQSAWWLVTFPGLAIVLIVLAFTMMGEGLTEIFNPKLRDR